MIFQLSFVNEGLLGLHVAERDLQVVELELHRLQHFVVLLELVYQRRHKLKHRTSL